MESLLDVSQTSETPEALEKEQLAQALLIATATASHNIGDIISGTSLPDLDDKLREAIYFAVEQGIGHQKLIATITEAMKGKNTDELDQKWLAEIIKQFANEEELVQRVATAPPISTEVVLPVEAKHIQDTRGRLREFFSRLAALFRSTYPLWP